MARHPLVPVSGGREHDDGDGAAQAPTQQDPGVQLDQRDELLLIRAAAQKIQQSQNGTDQDRYETQREEKLRGHHETRDEKTADLVVARGEGVVDPAAAHEEAVLSGVVGVAQRPEAVRPQAEAIQLGAGDAIVGDQPAGGGESHHDQNEREDEKENSDVSGQRPALSLQNKTR